MGVGAWRARKSRARGGAQLNPFSTSRPLIPLRSVEREEKEENQSDLCAWRSWSSCWVWSSFDSDTSRRDGTLDQRCPAGHDSFVPGVRSPLNDEHRLPITPNPERDRVRLVASDFPGLPCSKAIEIASSHSRLFIARSERHRDSITLAVPNALSFHHISFVLGLKRAEQIKKSPYFGVIHIHQLVSLLDTRCVPESFGGPLCSAPRAATRGYGRPGIRREPCHRLERDRTATGPVYAVVGGSPDWRSGGEHRGGSSDLRFGSFPSVTGPGNASI